MPLIQIILINIGHGLVHLLMLLFPVVAALATTFFDADYSTLIMLTTGSWIAFGLGALPAGWLADRWSRHSMMSIFFFGSSISCFLIAISQSYTQIALALFLLGIFASIYHPVGIAMLADGKPETMGRRLAFNGVWGNLGVAFSTITAASLANVLGWQAAFYIPGLISFAIGVIWLMFTPNHTQNDLVEKPQHNKSQKNNSNWLTIFKIIAFSSIIIGFMFNAAIVSLPKLLDDRLNTIGENVNSIGFLAFGIYIFAACAQLTVGHLIDRFRVKPIFITISMLLSCSMVLVIFSTDLFLIISISCMMALVYATLPISDTLLARNIPNHLRSRIFALIYLISFSASALAVPTIAILHLRDGFTTLFITLSILAFILALIITKLPEK